METIVQRIENPRLRPDHIDVTDAPVNYAPPKRSYLDPQGENQGFDRTKHVLKTAFRTLRRQFNTRAEVSPEEIETYSSDFRRQHRRELDAPRMDKPMTVLQRFQRLVTASF